MAWFSWIVCGYFLCGSKEFNSSRTSTVLSLFWALACCSCPTMTLSLFIKLPSLDTYIRFYQSPSGCYWHSRELSLLPQYRCLYDFLALASCQPYGASSVEEGCASQANRELNSYLALRLRKWQKTENRADCQRNSRHWVMPWRGISAGIDTEDQGLWLILIPVG